MLIIIGSHNNRCSRKDIKWDCRNADCFNCPIPSYPPTHSFWKKRVERGTRDGRWKFLDMVGANVSHRKSALRLSKRFPLFLHESRTRSARMQEMPYVMMHHEKNYTGNSRFYGFLRGPPGGGGEGGGLLVPVGAGTGQEVRRAGPGNRRVERHRQRTHATCMIWFVLFHFWTSLCFNSHCVVPFCPTRIARKLLVIPIISFSRLILGSQEIFTSLPGSTDELYVKLRLHVRLCRLFMIIQYAMFAIHR